jgi:hypothetical protein
LNLGDTLGIGLIEDTTPVTVIRELNDDAFKVETAPNLSSDQPSRSASTSTYATEEIRFNFLNFV